MGSAAAYLVVLVLASSGADGPGDLARTVSVNSRERSYFVHIPARHDPMKLTPVVLVFHGAGMTARMMAQFCGLNQKADEAGFVAVYPSGTGPADVLATWNSGDFQGLWASQPPDDVAFVGRLLDDLRTVVRVDPKRVYAAGFSNGGMMCYRLASELSERIAAIGVVAGTLGDGYKPKRSVPVIHFHGTADPYVPFNGPNKGTPAFLCFRSVEETIRICVKANGCPQRPVVANLPKKSADGTSVTKKTFAPCVSGADVVLVEVHGGGHTWPGREPPVPFLGKSTKNVSANELIWEFFEKHPMK